MSETEKDRPSSALVVEDDATFTKWTADGLKEHGFEHVAFCDNGLAGWRILSQKKYDVLVSDVNIPQMSGIVLLNRVRQTDALSHLPVVLMTGFLGKKNLSVIDEFFYTAVLEKPFKKEELGSTIHKMWEEKLWLEEKQRTLDAALAGLEESNGDAKFEQVKTLLASSPSSKLKIIVAKMFLESDRYDEAEELLAGVIDNDKKASPVALNELAKIYLLKGEAEKATGVLGSLSTLNDDNLQRLNTQGMAHLAIAQFEEAERYFSKASRTDPTFKPASSGLRVLENIKANGAAFKENYDRGLASQLNSIGIHLVRQGDFQGALDHYEAAMDVVPQKRLKSKLAFNVGYAFVRQKEPDKATRWFHKAVKFDRTNAKAITFSEKFSKGGVSGLDEILEVEMDAEDFGVVDEAQSDQQFKMVSGDDSGSFEGPKLDKDTIDYSQVNQKKKRSRR